MEQIQKRNKLPNLIVLGIILLCVIPFLLNLISWDFGSVRTSLGVKDLLDVPANQFGELLFTEFQGVFVHIILEWSSVSLALLTAILALVIFRITKNIALPIIGMALFCSAVMDTFHTLAAARLINAVASNDQFIPFTWALSRLFNAILLIGGALTYLFIYKGSKNFYQDQLRIRFVWIIILVIGIISYLTIHYTAISTNLPRTMFPESIIQRPFDVIPVALFVIAGIFIFPKFYRTEKTVFVYSLWVSLIPGIALGLYMAFGSGALFDNAFNIAHFLKIVTFAIPFMGLTYDYLLVYQEQQSKEIQLNSALAEILTNVPNSSFEEQKTYLMEKAATALGVDTVGLGSLSDDEREIHCDRKYILTEKQHYTDLKYGLEIDKSSIEYFGKQKYIEVYDIAKHPVFKKLIDINFIEETTISMLVIPLTHSGRFSGLILFGRQGHEKWTAKENGFGLSIAVLLSKFHEEHQKKINENKLIISERKLKNLVENLPQQFFYSHDTQGEFTYISPSIKNILGLSTSEFMGKYDKYFIGHPLNEKAREYTEKSIKGIQQPPYEIMLSHKDGSIKTLEISEIPIMEDNVVVGVEGIARDVTQQKNIQENLIEKSKQLLWLNSGSKMLFESENNEDIFKQVCDQLRDLTGCIICSYSSNIKNNKFQLSAVSSDKETLKKINEITKMDVMSHVFSFESTLYEKLCRNEILINYNVSADISILSVDNENKNRMFSEIGVTNGHSFPIINNNSVIGVAFLGTDKRLHQSFTEIIRLFLKQVNITIQRNYSNIELQNYSNTQKAINKAQELFINDPENKEVFDELRDQLIQFTKSEFGFIAQLMTDDDGAKYLKVHSITNIAWDEFSTELYQKHLKEGLEFRNMDMLFGSVVKTGKWVISNDPENDPRSAGTPKGHPKLNSFLGVPFYQGDKLLGVVGLGNKKEGYTEKDIEFINPILSTVVNLVDSYNSKMRLSKSDKILKGSEQKYRDLFENAPVMMVSMAYKKNVPIVTDCNNLFIEVMGYNKEEIINHPLSDFYSTTSAKSLLDHGYKEAVQPKFSVKRELKKKDGSLVLTYLQSYPITQKGKIRGAMDSYTDITELEKQRQTVENREQELSWLYGSMTQITNLTDNHELYKNIINSVFDFSGAILTVFASYDEGKFNAEIFKSDPEVQRNVERIAKVKYDEISVRFNPKLLKLLSKGKHLMFDDTFGGISESKTKFLTEMIKVLEVEEMHVFPLVLKEQLIGICLLATHKSQLLSHNIINSINSFFNQASIILQRNIYLEETIKSSKELLQLIDTANAPIFGIDTLGLINEWNQTAERITGFEKKETIGKNLVEDFIPKEFRTSVKTVLDNALEGNETANFEFPLFTNKGERLMILLNASTRRDVDANIIGVLGVGQDITQRKRIEIEMEKEKNKFNTLFENSSIPFAVLHPEKGFLLVNEATVKLFGCKSKEEVINIGPEKFSPEYQFNNELTMDRAKKNMDEAFEKGVANFDWIHITLNGKEIICNVNLNIIELDGEKVLQTAMLDVSSERESERQIIELNTNLEQKVESRTKELAMANKVLKKAERDIRASLVKEKELNELKSKFVSMASHEFRTPLTAILSASDILKRYRDRMTKTEVRGKIDKIQTEVKGLVNILEDFLIIGKSHAGKSKFNPEKIDFKFFCDELINDLRITTGKNHHISYVFEEPEMVVNLDLRLMKHITTNLLSNAIKYSAAGSKIEFRIAKSNGFIVMQINDEGIGIPEKDLKYLFHTFHRASNVGIVSGTGLGMAIIKQSVELHNGQITVNSTEGVGTEIEVTIPYKI